MMGKDGLRQYEMRGLRNNNPGNIRLSPEMFKGEISPSSDPAFKQFRSIAYGYRAMFAILRTYINTHKLITIRQIINRWAPKEDGNDTDAYIYAVCRYANIKADEELIFDKKDMCAIVAAMSKVENGIFASMQDVETGWYLL